jgi:CheY-like chemotaxis protein
MRQYPEVQVFEQHNGLKAVNQMETQGISSKVKLIFMDCNMPVLDGLKASRTLRVMMEEKKIPEIPIVGVSAYD